MGEPVVGEPVGGSVGLWVGTGVVIVGNKVGLSVGLAGHTSASGSAKPVLKERKKIEVSFFPVVLGYIKAAIILTKIVQPILSLISSTGHTPQLLLYVTAH